MTKVEKAQYIDELAANLSGSSIIYLADTAGLTVESVNNLRRKCFQSNIQMKVVKNSLLEKAMEKVEGKDFGDLKSVLAGPTSILFAEIGNAPAKLIKDFRKKNAIPALKGAYIDEAIFLGDNNLEFLSTLKSKEEVLGEVIGLLQSPAKNVISGLKASGGKIAGLLKTLEERA